MLRGDESCRTYAKNYGKDPATECPPDQPVCRARRAIIPPGIIESIPQLILKR